MAEPLWKRAFDAVERGSSPTLTKALSDPDVIEAITLTSAVRRRAQSDLAGIARRGLHLFNLPAGTDISKVSHQVAGLEREIRMLNRRIETLQAVPSPAPEPAAPTPTKKKKKKKKNPAKKKQKDS